MTDKLFSSRSRIILTRIIAGTLVLYILFSRNKGYLPPSCRNCLKLQDSFSSR